VTILAGPVRQGRAIWEEWLALAGRPARSIFEQPAGAEGGWLDRTVREAVELAGAAPREPIALAVERPLLEAWLTRRDDRLAAVVREGIVTVPVISPAARPAIALAEAPWAKAVFARKARSLAETTLFVALQETPATAGRFELNGRLSVSFGHRAAEVDLLSREDEIAIEVDGFYHFTGPAAYRRDRRKDAVLQGHGYAVLRFLATDVQSDWGAGAVRAVLELMGHRRRQKRRRA
jgi:very-short-patch-repair endonuclease